VEEPIYERRETVIIINPAAHNMPSEARLKEIDDWLRAEGWHVDWQRTEKAGDATGLAIKAADRRVPLVMALGGDGTLNEVANGLAHSGTVLGAIPGGTSNLWAREAGLDRKPLEAVQAIVTGNIRRLDLGKADSRYFMLLCGFGIDAEITKHVSLEIKNRLGAAAYGLSAVRELFRWRGKEITVWLDGFEERINVLMALIGNTRLYAGLTQITPTAVADDGLLEVCIYRGSGKRDIALHATRTLLRRHRESNKVLYRRCAKIEFEWGANPLSAQVDGDPLPYTVNEVVVAPSALLVAVPAAVMSPLFALPALAARPAELTLPRQRTG
jgi:YegS/Rv2252/BmrU family lipid kinase